MAKTERHPSVEGRRGLLLAKAGEHLSQIESFASAAGFRVRKHFFDRRRWFADSLWQSV
jgi:hypothetical protein